MFVAAELFVATMTGTLFLVGDQSDSVLPVDPVEQEPVDFSVGFSASAVLAEVPRFQIGTDANTTISALDIAEVAELAGVERIGFVGSDVEWDWILARGAVNQDATPIVAMPWPVNDMISVAFRWPQEFEAELGWAGGDVDAFIKRTTFFQSQSERELVPSINVFRLRSDMSELANRAPSEGIIDVGSGDDFDTEFEPFLQLRPDGVPLRVGVDQDRSTVAISPSTPAVRSWLSRGSAMAEQANAHELALALDRTGDLYAVEMTFGDFQMRPSLFDTQRTSIVYVFESDDAASTSAWLSRPCTNPTPHSSRIRAAGPNRQ